LGIADALDGAVGPVKQRRRGLTAGGLSRLAAGGVTT